MKISQSRSQNASTVRHLTEHELAARLSVSVRTLQGWHVRGDGIPFIKVERFVRDVIDQLERWERGHVSQSTSATGACSIHEEYDVSLHNAWGDVQ